jgi:hypothetical protein
MLFNTCSSLQKHNTCSIYCALVFLMQKLRDLGREEDFQAPNHGDLRPVVTGRVAQDLN